MSAIARRRAIQESILRDLAIRLHAAPGLPLLWRHLVYGFATSCVPYAEDELRVAVGELVERGLVRSEQTPGLGDLPEIGYTLTADGLGFYECRCPWERLGSFSRRA